MIIILLFLFTVCVSGAKWYVFTGKSVVVLVTFRICLSKQSEDDEKDNEEGDNKGTPKGRKKIRRIIVDEHLRSETQRALKEEEERRRRLAEREQREDFREVHYTQLTLSMHCRIHALSEMSY